MASIQRLVLLLLAYVTIPKVLAGDFLVGLGTYDITGPASDVNMMGYGNSAQNTAGIHFRLHARTFIVADPQDVTNRFAFVNIDACMASDVVTLKVLESLNARYGGLYTEHNVAISGIHTHSGPGGFLQYVLYIVTAWGFVHQSFEALVDGIVNSVVEAHDNLQQGSIFVNIDELQDANINRSPSAYTYNPPEERERYQYDVDKDMTLLKFVDDVNGPLGAFSWFATHGTSMNRTNQLISGDNKGAASRLMEDSYNSNQSTSSLKSRRLMRNSDGLSLHKSFTPKRIRNGLAGSKPPFIAAFCQSNVGDTSPNVLGAFCVDTGLPCDFNHSTCNGKNELCIGQGPAYPDDFASTQIIADRQFKKATELFESASKKLAGKIDYRHTYVDFSNIDVTLQNGTVVSTCPAAVGFSFAAGTTDGRGAFNFVQGDNQGNPFWKMVGSLLKSPSKKQTECQKPKPILIDTGEMFTPYAWAPSVLPLQILRLGNFVLLCVPSEFTTMAGRRLREAVKATLIMEGDGDFNNDTIVVIAGLTNSYSQYVATFEEYQAQRYEGASTLFGPHTLSAYIQEFTKLAAAMAQGKLVDVGPAPLNTLAHQIELLPGVVVDATPLGVKFGDVIDDVPPSASFHTGDTVTVSFWSACPRNDLFTESTFSMVEMLDGQTGEWMPVYDDDDLCLRFMWSRPWALSSYSQATIRWDVPNDVLPGTYRLHHFGAAKHLFSSELEYFDGVSGSFVVS